LARASACHAEGRGFESHHPLFGKFHVQFRKRTELRGQADGSLRFAPSSPLPLGLAAVVLGLGDAREFYIHAQANESDTEKALAHWFRYAHDEIEKAPTKDPANSTIAPKRVTTSPNGKIAPDYGERRKRWLRSAS
jgi:hypothetical protein